MTLLLGFSSGKSKGPFGIEFIGYAITSSATTVLSETFDLGIPYADRSIWVGTIGRSSNPSAISVGGVSAGAYAVLTLNPSYLGWYKAVGVPGSAGISVTVQMPVSQHFLFGVFSVTGALGGADVAPEGRGNGKNNDNAISVVFPSRSVGDIFLGIGVKPGSGSAWAGFSGNPAESDPLTLLDATFGDSNGGFGRSVQQAGTSQATITSQGSDSSKAIGINCLRFSKGI